jgi:superfamily II DNA/RNA helicase
MNRRNTTNPTSRTQTLAYLVPLLTTLMAKHPARLVDGQPPKPRSWVGIEALVVAPSQELAMQIVRVARSLLPPNAQPAVQQLIGGANASRQRELMKKHKPLVGIGTPGRIAKLLEVQSLQMQRHAVVVFDEVGVFGGRMGGGMGGSPFTNRGVMCAELKVRP